MIVKVHATNVQQRDSSSKNLVVVKKFDAHIDVGAVIHELQGVLKAAETACLAKRRRGDRMVKQRPRKADGRVDVGSVAKVRSCPNAGWHRRSRMELALPRPAD